jgi:urease accessory protein
MRQRLLFALAALMLAPQAALAHPEHGEAASLLHGLMHPLGGLDHVLAMVTVGILAAQVGGRALWLVPGTFVALMLAGGAVGMAGITLPGMEVGVALSLVVLGGVVALGLRAPVAAVSALAGLFAVAHGYAHGAEMPADAAAAGYALGFVLATAALHGAGIGIAMLLGPAAAGRGQLALRTAGGAVALAGVAVLAATL